MDKRLISCRRFFFVSIAVLSLLPAFLIYLNACPTVKNIQADPAVFCKDSMTQISFTADWSEEDCWPWDANHTIKWKYKKDDGEWTDQGTIQLNPDGGGSDNSSAGGSFHIYGSADAGGFTSGDPHLDGPGNYSIKVEAKGEKDGNTGWGEIGTVAVTVVGLEIVDDGGESAPEIWLGTKDDEQEKYAAKVTPEGLSGDFSWKINTGQGQSGDAKIVDGKKTATVTIQGKKGSVEKEDVKLEVTFSMGNTGICTKEHGITVVELSRVFCEPATQTEIDQQLQSAGVKTKLSSQTDVNAELQKGAWFGGVWLKAGTRENQGEQCYIDMPEYMCESKEITVKVMATKALVGEKVKLEAVDNPGELRFDGKKTTTVTIQDKGDDQYYGEAEVTAKKVGAAKVKGEFVKKDTIKVEEGETTIVGVKSLEITQNDITTTSPDSQGNVQTVYVTKGDKNDTITITANPDPESTAGWPEDSPTWENATARADDPSKATFPIDALGAKTVKASCGESSKSINIEVIDWYVTPEDAVGVRRDRQDWDAKDTQDNPVSCDWYIKEEGKDWEEVEANATGIFRGDYPLGTHKIKAVKAGTEQEVIVPWKLIGGVVVFSGKKEIVLPKARKSIKMRVWTGTGTNPEDTTYNWSIDQGNDLVNISDSDKQEVEIIGKKASSEMGDVKLSVEIKLGDVTYTPEDIPATQVRKPSKISRSNKINDIGTLHGIEMEVTLQVEDALGPIKANGMKVDETITDKWKNEYIRENTNFRWDESDGSTNRDGNTTDVLKILSTGKIPGKDGDRLATCKQKIEIDGIECQPATKIEFKSDGKGDAEIFVGGVQQNGE